MTKKLRENFYILLTSNIITVTLICLLQIMYDCYLDNNGSDRPFSHFTSLSVIVCIICAVIISTILTLLMRSNASHIIINNNVNPAQDMNIDDVENIRERFRIETESKEKNIIAAIRDYTHVCMAPFISDNDLESLVQNIKLFKIPDAIITPINSNTKLSALDLRHYGWNIGERLGWSGQKRAMFIKLCFPKEMKDWEIETIRRNLRQKGTNNIIDIDVPDKNKYDFHY